MSPSGDRFRATRRPRAMPFLVCDCLAAAILGAAACIPDLPPDADLADAGPLAPEATTDSTVEDSPANDGGGSDEGPDGGPDGAPLPTGLPCGDTYVDLGIFEQCDPPSPGKCNPDCTMQCEGGVVWEENNHCYMLFDASVTDLAPSTGTANGLCQSNGLGHVVTFADEDEFRVVGDYALDAGLGGAAFWVGLEDFMHINHYASINDYEPGWSAACTGCYAHLADGSMTIPSGGTSEYCVEAFAGAQVPSWKTLKCTGAPRTRVLCEREPNPAQWKRCDAGEFCIDLKVTYNQKRYVYHDGPLPPDQAAQSCAAEGGRLVVLQSSHEREQLWYQLQSIPTAPQAFWIGLSLTDAPDAEAGTAQWTWEDGTPAESYPSEWARSEPASVEAGVAARALLAHLFDTTDDTLAHVTSSPQQMPFVCEIAKP